ncbi:MAG: adenylate/guanylate cyclase domain-containing protein [Arenicellales bacterium]|nr:adenylate/guanylate cyclase domain-containing protein [Arenicellales bacterium]
MTATHDQSSSDVDLLQEQSKRELSVGSLRLRYCLGMASVALVDIGMNSVYFILADRPVQLLILLPENLLLLGVLNLLVALQIYKPIDRFIRQGVNPAGAQEALTHLPLRSAIWVAVLSAGYCGIVFLTNTFTPEPALLDRVPEWKRIFAFIWFSFVYASYYSFYIFFLVDNLAMHQRAALFQGHGLEIEPREHRFRNKLVFAFLVVALVPASHLILDILVFRDLRLAQGFSVTSTVLLDLFATVVVLCFAVVLVIKGMLRPVRELTSTVRDIDKGILDRRAPVISDDELGVLMRAVNQMVDGLKERAFIRETFGRYVPEAVAADIIAGKAPIDPKIETATILFADIEDFTGLAEKLSPAELVEVLNEYFSAVIKPINRHNGVVNQFQGDGMLVTFNIPLRDRQHADSAVSAALEIIEAVNKNKFGGIHLRTRIGINTGLVFAGNVGSGDRFNYTVHGDAVNIASRLESLNKDMGTQLLISSATFDLLNCSYPLAKQKSVNVKGRGQPIGVYSLCETELESEQEIPTDTADVSSPNSS